MCGDGGHALPQHHIARTQGENGLSRLHNGKDEIRPSVESLCYGPLPINTIPINSCRLIYL